ncbi:Rho GTPase activating protein 39, variant 2 [Balamuthia mandrillaris]
MSGHHKLMKAADVQPPPPLKVPPLPMTDGADADRTVKLPPAPEPSGPARPKVSFFDPSKLNTGSPSVAQAELEPRSKSNRARSASSLTMGRTKELNPESKVAILSSNLGGILAGSPPSERAGFLPQLMTNHGDAKSAPPSPAQLRRSDTLPGLASGSPPPVQRAYLGPTRSSSSDGLDLSSIRRGGSSPLRVQLSTSAGSAELSRTLPKLNSSPSLALKTVNAKPSAGEFSFGGGNSDNLEEAEDGGSGNNKRSSLRRVVAPMKSRSVTCDNLQRSIQEEKGRQTCLNEESSAASSEGSALRRSESSGPPAFGPSSTKAKALAATLKLQMRLPGEAPPFLDEVKQRQTQLPQPPQQPQQGLQQQQQQPPQSQQQLHQQQQGGALLGPNIPQGMAARRSVRDSSRRRSLPLGIVGSPDNRKSYGLQLDTIVELLNGPNGLPTEKKARKQKGETFSRWFTGKRAAEWFMEQQLVETMEEATEFGNLLIRTGLFFPVVAGDSFKPRKKSIYALQKQPEIQKGGAPPVESETRVMISAISSDSIDSSSLTQIGSQEQLKQEEEKERKQIEEQEQRKKESLKQILERKSNKKEKEKKQKEQQSLKKKELAEKKKEERAKRKSRRKSRKMAGVYGASLDYVMSLQEDEHPELEIPIVLMALTKSLMDLNGAYLLLSPLSLSLSRSLSLSCFTCSQIYPVQQQCSPSHRRHLSGAWNSGRDSHFKGPAKQRRIRDNVYKSSRGGRMPQVMVP